MPLTKTIEGAMHGALTKPLGGFLAPPAGLSFAGGGTLLDGAFLAGALPASQKMSMVIWTTRATNVTNCPISFNIDLASGSETMLQVAGTGQMDPSGADDGIGQFLRLSNVGEYVINPAWRCTFLNVDYAQAAGSRVRYWNGDAEVVYAALETMQGASFNWGAYKLIVLGGAPQNVQRPGFNWNGSIAEAWFVVGTLIDFSVQANRRLFMNGVGRAVTLAKDGTVISGGSIRPHFYFSARQGEAPSAFLANRGSVALTGGALSVTTGALVSAGSNP